MRYSYFVVYQYVKKSFDFGNFSSIVNFYTNNAEISFVKPLEYWTWEDYEEIKKMLANAISSDTIKYKQEDIYILNVMKMKGKQEDEK